MDYASLTNHQICREAERLFESSLPPQWAFRDLGGKEDYGVDGEVEVTDAGDQATGKPFKVQLKGTIGADHDEAGNLSYSRAAVDRFTYYVEKLQIPLIYIICDLPKGECFWLRVQGNTAVESALRDAIAANQKTFTITIPAAQKVQKTGNSPDQILQAVAASWRVISLRMVKDFKGPDVQADLRSAGSFEEIGAQLRRLAGIVTTEVIGELLAARDFEGAIKKATPLFESETENAEVRIHTGMALAQAFERLINRREQRGANPEFVRIRLEIANKMIAIARRPDCPKIARKYARIFLRSSRLRASAFFARALSRSDFGLRLQGQTLTGPLIHLQRIENQSRVTRDYTAILRDIPRLAKGAASLIPFALGEAMEGLLASLEYLDRLGEGELVKAYAAAAAQFLPAAFAVLDTLGEEDLRRETQNLGIRFVSISVFGWLGHDELLQKFEETVRSMRSRPARDEALQAVRRFFYERQMIPAETKPTWEEVRTFFTRAAEDMGIDLSDPEDTAAQLVRIGLEDLNPTQYLKNCVHTHLAFPYPGGIAEILGMPTAGMKRVVCLKHGHSVDNLRLKVAYDIFARKDLALGEHICCETCADKAPHPEDWDLPDDWEKEQHLRYMVLQRQHPPGEV